MAASKNLSDFLRQILYDFVNKLVFDCYSTHPNMSVSKFTVCGKVRSISDDVLLIQKVHGVSETDIIQLKKDAEAVPASELQTIFRDHCCDDDDKLMLVNNSNRFQYYPKTGNALLKRTISGIVHTLNTATGHPLLKGLKHAVSGKPLGLSMAPKGLPQAVHLDTMPHPGLALIVIFILTEMYDLMVQPNSALSHEQEADEWSTKTAMRLRMDAGNLLVMRSFVRHGGAENATELWRHSLHMGVHVVGEKPMDLNNETVIEMVGRKDLTLRSSSKMCFASALQCV